MAIHSETAKAMMKHYYIGTLETSLLKKIKENTERELPPSRETFLLPNQWANATLSHKKILGPDARLFSFKLDYDNQVFGLPVGQHVMLRIKDP
ncbi:hypothetical protein VTO42DRAFT_8457 [Malbranchea cinnamomea]